MGRFQNKGSAKKKIVIVVGILLVVIIVLVLGNASSNQKRQGDKNQNNVAVLSPRNVTVPTVFPTRIPTTPTASGRQYTNSTYTVRYPQNWDDKTQELGSDAQGAFLYLKPPTVVQGEDPKVVVEMMDQQQGSIDNISGGLVFLGLTKENATVSGIAAQKYSGIVRISDEPLHNTVYLFEHNAKIYLIKLSYKQENVDTQLEAQFQQMINTFVLP